MCELAKLLYVQDKTHIHTSVPERRFKRNFLLLEYYKTV